MKTKHKIKLLKWDSIIKLEDLINSTIENNEKEWWTFKIIKDVHYDKYEGYLFILVFYKL